MCDMISHMSSLNDYIKARPGKPLGQWAKAFGISRPHLYSLMDGTRNPSLDVARRIEAETQGDVPIRDWPNIAAVLSAAAGDAA